MKKQLLLSILIFMIHINANAQCNLPAPPSKICTAAPIICPLDGYCSSAGNANSIDQPTTFCGSIQNNSWIAFIAGTTELTIDFIVGACEGTGAGTGIQAQIFAVCGDPWTSASNCLYEVSPGSTEQFTMINLTIGNTYYLMTDGFSGDVCNYTLSVTSGSTQSSGGNFLADAGPDVVIDCNNQQAVLDGSNSTLPANSIFQWINETGDVLSTDLTFTTNEPGSYFFIINENVVGCNSIDEVVVTAEGIFNLELGADQYLPCNETLEIIGDTIPLGSNYSYSWYTFDGHLVSGESTPTPIINNPGTYELTIFDNTGLCSFTDEITIWGFDDILTVESMYQVNCNNTQTFMEVATLSATSPDLSFSWTTADGVIVANATQLIPVISSIGNYTLVVTDNLTGCTALGTTTVFNTEPNPTVQIDVNGNGTLSCNNSTFILNGNNSSSNGNQIVFEWENSDGGTLGYDPVLDINQPGVYTLIVSDLVTGCYASDQIEIFADTDLPDFDLTNSSFELNCGNNFTNEVAVILQSQGSASYLWTGPDNFSSTDSSVIISGNVDGDFEVVVTNDGNGCTASQIVNVVNNGFEMNVNTTSATCDMQDGTATISTGLPNPEFAWSTGDTTNSISNLAQGWYSVTITDLDNNCGKHQNFYVDEDISCKVVLSGYVVNDLDLTCAYDATLEGIECVMVKIEPLGFYTMTDATGYYEFIVDDGSYTLEYIGNPEVELLCPLPGTYDVTLNSNGTVDDDNHFYVERKELDLCITKFTGNARPGFDQFNCIQICNYSEDEQDAVATFVHDSLFSDQTPWPSISPAYNNTIALLYSYDAATNTFTWNLDDMAPGECRKIMWYMPVPLTAVLGDTISSQAKVNPIFGDTNPDNNCLVWSQEITNSYDPNDKRNFVGETQWGGAIYEDDLTMEYAIRFQNVGNNTAFTVVVRDTLDEAHLDVTTIRGFTASHNMQVQFEKSNILVFTFENIMLVDSATNELASNGWLNFDIDRKTDLPFGTEITNQAAIYFDFNEPVITNELVNVLTNPVSIFSPTKNTLDIEITPTVTNDEIRVNYVLEKNNSVSIQVYNIGGVLLQDVYLGEKPTGEHTENLSLIELNSGVYFIFVKTEEGNAVQKIVKI